MEVLVRDGKLNVRYANTGAQSRGWQSVPISQQLAATIDQMVVANAPYMSEKLIATLPEREQDLLQQLVRLSFHGRGGPPMAENSRYTRVQRLRTMVSSIAVGNTADEIVEKVYHECLSLYRADAISKADCDKILKSVKVALDELKKPEDE